MRVPCRRLLSGVNKACPMMFGPPMSRASRQTTAASPPPALQPHDREPARYAAECLGIVGDPPHRGHGVVDRGREPVLGRVTVIRRDENRVASHAKVPAQRIVRNGVAQNPTPAVEVHDDRVRARGRRPVQPVRQIA